MHFLGIISNNRHFRRLLVLTPYFYHFLLLLGPGKALLILFWHPQFGLFALKRGYNRRFRCFFILTPIKRIWVSLPTILCVVDKCDPIKPILFLSGHLQNLACPPILPISQWYAL